MTVNVVSIPATTTVDLNKAFTMQGLFNTVYSSLPDGKEYTVTGISFEFMGMSCANSGIIDTYAQIKDAISRLYNYIMKSYLEPIWQLLNALLKALEAVVGKLLDLDLSLPILNLTVSDLFSDNLYEKLLTAITNLYHTAIDDLKSLLNFLGIPFETWGGSEAPQIDIANIVKNVMVSLWSALLQKIKLIFDAIKTGLAAYDYITSPGTFPPPLSTIWNTALSAIGEEIVALIALGGPTIKAIQDAIVDFVKAALNKAVVTAEEILAYLKNFTLSPFGKPFDWEFPFNPFVDSAWKDLSQLLGDMKLFCINFLGLLIAQFIKLIDAILKVFGLSLSFPVLTIHYSVCAIIKE